MTVTWWAIAAPAVVVLCVAAMISAGWWLSPIARREIVTALERKYHGDVELGSLTASLFPFPRARGERLSLRTRGGTLPLIAISQFEAETGWLGLLRSPLRIRRVRLDGLEIVVARGRRERANEGPPRQPKSPVLIDELLAHNTLLRILPRNPAKEPLTYDIYQLTLNSVGLDRAMHYRAQLRNATPPGLIHATGNFGPWDGIDPGQSPVNGDYRFDNADLGAFKGLAGKLSSTGNYRGLLEKIEVNGVTDTPDFTVRAGNHPVHLKTTFSATVDGTDGDTLLHPVTAQFGETTVVARGGVTGTPGVHGKTVALEATVRDGDLADVLRMGVKSDPPMTGRISFHAKLQIPPGNRDIAEKLYLKGRFDIESGKFTKPSLQNKVAGLSARAQVGETPGPPSRTTSDIGGAFVLDQGVITLTGLSFRVPGAAIRLNGTYGLLTEKLDFRGTATMDAKLSEMTTGVKSFLLKALDPIFHKNKAGTVIPLQIGGTRQDPSFGLSLKP